jgi:hypothetical protein
LFQPISSFHVFINRSKVSRSDVNFTSKINDLQAENSSIMVEFSGLKEQCYPIGRREVPKFLGTGVLVAAPPKLTIIEVVLINNHKSNSNEILKSNIKIFDI